MARSQERRLKTHLLKYKQEAEKANCKRLVAFKASNLPLMAHSSSPAHIFILFFKTDISISQAKILEVTVSLRGQKTQYLLS